jgi:hypothetical protein
VISGEDGWKELVHPGHRNLLPNAHPRALREAEEMPFHICSHLRIGLSPPLRHELVCVLFEDTFGAMHADQIDTNIIPTLEPTPRTNRTITWNVFGKHCFQRWMQPHGFSRTRAEARQLDGVVVPDWLTQLPCSKSAFEFGKEFLKGHRMLHEGVEDGCQTDCRGITPVLNARLEFSRYI